MIIRIRFWRNREARSSISPLKAAPNTGKRAVGLCKVCATQLPNFYHLCIRCGEPIHSVTTETATDRMDELLATLRPPSRKLGSARGHIREIGSS